MVLSLLTAIIQPEVIFFLPFLFLLIFSFHRSQRANPNLPPGPQPFPIIGNLHNLGGLPHLSFHRLSEKYGPLIYLKLGQIPTIIVSNADMASQIMKSQDNVFCSRSQLTALKRLSYGSQDIASSPFDDHFKQVRRLCNTEVFNLAKVQSFAGIRRDEVNTLINTITKASSRQEAVNLSEILLCCTNNILFRAVFGKRISGEGECESSPLKNLLRDIMSLVTDFAVEDLFPSMGWIDVLTGWRRKLGRTFEKMDSMFDEVIRERILMKSGRENTSSVLENFLDVLLHLHAGVEDDQSLTMNEIKAILLDMFAGGTDTQSASVEWGMTRLMKNPAAMKKAQAEIRRVVGDKRKVEESDLQHLHYLKMVIKETLRLHPPGPIPVPRECMKDTKVAGYDILAKTRVYVNIWSIGRDPKYWGDDAEDFRPERFENNGLNFRGANLEFIPFGAGRRICPGMPLAIAGIELVFASLLHEFDWALPDGMVKEDIDLGANSGLVCTKKVSLVLVPTPRVITKG